MIFLDRLSLEPSSMAWTSYWKTVPRGVSTKLLLLFFMALYQNRNTFSTVPVYYASCIGCHCFQYLLSPPWSNKLCSNFIKSCWRLLRFCYLLNYNLLLFRTPEVINQELKRIEQYLKKIKEEHGEDWMDLQRKLDERQAGFDEVSSDLSILKMLIQVMKIIYKFHTHVFFVRRDTVECLCISIGEVCTDLT